MDDQRKEGEEGGKVKKGKRKRGRKTKERR